MSKYLITTVASVLLVVALYFTAQHYLNVEYKKGYDAAISEVSNKQLENKQAKQDKVYQSAIQDNTNEIKLKSIIANSNATIIGLRNIIEQDSKQQSETIAAADARTATYRELFLTCSERYSRMARETDEVNLVVHGLQGYVRALDSYNE